MKRTVIGLSMLLGAAVAGAHEGQAGKAEAGKLTGEVIDMTCYLDHDATGEKHADCARKCIEKGLPVGLLVNGKVYTVVMSNHETPNAKLAPYAGKKVTIKGKVMEKGGLRAIDMESVEPAAAAAAPTK